MNSTGQNHGGGGAHSTEQYSHDAHQRTHHQHAQQQAQDDCRRQQQGHSNQSQPYQQQNPMHKSTHQQHQISSHQQQYAHPNHTGYSNQQHQPNYYHQHHQHQQQPQQQQQPTSTHLYSAEKLAGSGSFGLVYQARIIDPVTGEPGEVVAIKKVYLDPDFKNRELQIMSELSHPCVVSLHHCFYIQDPSTNKTYMNLVMSYVPENIHTHIRSHSRSRTSIHIDLVRRYIYQILRGLAYVHGKGICHRDLKPHNILINASTSEVKLCDFGSAKRLNPTENNVSYICSRFYRAPELALGARRYTTAIDMWSAGCVFAELITGKPLFSGAAPEDQILCIIQTLGVPALDDYPAMEVKEKDAQDQINNALRSPSRPAVHRSIHQNYQGTGLALALGPHQPHEALDLLTKLLTYNPTKRITAFQALAHPFFEPLHLPYENHLSQSNHHWEINQHQWSEDEATQIAAMPIADRAMLFPPWLKQFSNKKIQNLAGYPEIQRYHDLMRTQHPGKYTQVESGEPGQQELNQHILQQQTDPIGPNSQIPVEVHVPQQHTEHQQPHQLQQTQQQPYQGQKQPTKQSQKSKPQATTDQQQHQHEEKSADRQQQQQLNNPQNQDASNTRDNKDSTRETENVDLNEGSGQHSSSAKGQSQQEEFIGQVAQRVGQPMAVEQSSSEEPFKELEDESPRGERFEEAMGGDHQSNPNPRQQSRLTRQSAMNDGDSENGTRLASLSDDLKTDCPQINPKSGTIGSQLQPLSTSVRNQDGEGAS